MATACYAHPTSPSVVTCQQCSRGLCTLCEQQLGNICHGCNLQNAHSVRSSIISRLIGAAIGAIIGAVLFASMGSTSSGPHHHASAAPWWLPFLGMYLGAGLVYGAKYAEYPFHGWIVSAQLWLAGKVMQWVLAVFVGAIVLPFALIGDIRLLRDSAQVTAAIRSAD